MIQSNHYDTVRRNANDAIKTSATVADLTTDVDKLYENVADAYDKTQTYNVGDLCLADGELVKCNTASTTGDYDPTKWTATNIVTELTITGVEIKKVEWSGDDSGLATHTVTLDNGHFVLGLKGVRDGVYNVVFNSFYLFDSQRVAGFGGYPEDDIATTVTFSEGSLTFTGTNNATGMNDPDALYTLYYI